MIITQICEPEAASRIARTILEALPDWFGVPDSREGYIRDAARLPCFAALEGDAPAGFLCLKPTGDATIELAVMGVLPEYHRRGLGRRLFAAARDYARRRGFRFMQVKTVRMGIYEDYDRTNRFYRAMGFREFECLPELWDADNPCQIYVLSLDSCDGILGRTVNVTVDRPLGSVHPEHPDLRYPVNYGYVAGVLAPDGEAQDAYVLGVDAPVAEYTGRVAAIIHRRDDIEDKWVVCPEGVCLTCEAIRDAVRFQEQFFDSEIIL